MTEKSKSANASETLADAQAGLQGSALPVAISAMAKEHSALAVATELARVNAAQHTVRDHLEKVLAAPSRAEAHSALALATELARANAAQHTVRDHLEKILAAHARVDLRLPGPSPKVSVTLPRLLEETEAARKAAKPPESNDHVNPTALEVTSPQALGALIRQARERQKLSQQAFADLAGVGRRFVSELENGKATLEFGKVLKVAHAAGIALVAQTRG